MINFITNPIFLVVIACIFVILGIYIIIPKIIEKKYNISKILEDIKKGLTITDNLLDCITNMTDDNLVINIMDKIVEYAITGVDAAEQMYKANMLEKDERKEYAKNVVYSCIEILGIEKDENVDKLIDAAIEATVYSLKQ